MQIATTTLKIDDRIDYLLTGTMKGNVAAAFDFADTDTSLSQDFIRHQNVAFSAAATDRYRRRVLDKYEGVLDLAFDTLVNELQLN